MKVERFSLIPAVYLVLRRGEEILLSERANTGYQDGMFGLVAGHLEGNELATNAVVREASEEAGISINPLDLEFSHVCHRLGRNQVGQERIDLFFTCWKFTGEVRNMEPLKCSNLGWYPLLNLPQNTIPLVRTVLAATSAGQTYSEYTEEPV